MHWKIVVLNLLLFVTLQASGNNFIATGVDEDKLNDKALPVHRAALALTKDPDNEAMQQAYIEAFPIEFSVFLQIFHPNDFGQLSDGYSYIDLFNKTALKFPETSVKKYMALASKACFDADAPNYFQKGLRNFKNTYTDLYNQQHQLLNQEQKNNVKLFLNANFHPHDSTAGFCNF